MKRLIIMTITLMLFANCFDLDAQAKRKNKRAKAVVVHKPGKKVIITKKPRKRARRTKVVHYRYRHLPRRGAIVTTINTSAIKVKYSGIGYRYYSGVWYRPNGAKWIVVRPPLGVKVRILPNGYRRLAIGPRNYYYYYGTYYIKTGDEYQVAEAPIGAEVTSLPEGYNTVNINNQEYYELDGNYYMPSIDENNEEILVLVNDPNK